MEDRGSRDRDKLEVEVEIRQMSEQFRSKTLMKHSTLGLFTTRHTSINNILLLVSGKQR